MRGGQLRHTITIQSPDTGTPGDYGGKTVVSWSDFATSVRAGIRPMSGKALFAAQAVQNMVDTEITVRYMSGITSAMRVKHGSTYYDIDAVINIEMRNIKILLLCKTGISDG